MGKKPGKKASYIVYGGQEEKDLINGKELGVSFAKYNNRYYTMLPQDTGRTKRKWLSKDVNNAVLQFRAIVRGLKGQQNTTVSIEKYDTEERMETQEATTRILTSHLKDAKLRALAGIELNGDESKEVTFYKKVPTIEVPEENYIQWLKKELKNPEKLAKKTGIDAFNYFHDKMIQEPIKLKDLYTNYCNSNKYQKMEDNDEKKKTKKCWSSFVELIGKACLEQITLDDIKKYEAFLYAQKLADKTIHHYKNRVAKIFRFNLKNYEDTSVLLQVLSYFDKWEDLEINSSDTISAQIISYDDFMILYNRADEKQDLQLKAVFTLCLNTATYIREVARFKISDINLKEQTLMTKRNKKGRCKKFAYLWDRTIADLKGYLQTRKDRSDILFIAKHGGPYLNGQGLRTRIYELRKECDLLRVEFCHLRDTFQTLANENGVHQYQSNMVMGHSTGKTMERYSHRRVHNELKKACLTVERAFFEEKDGL